MASFEEKLTSLETIVDRLERGELTLDESVRLFEEGVQLSNACKSELDTAEGRIQVLLDPRRKGEASVSDLALGREEAGSEEEEDPEEDDVE